MVLEVQILFTLIILKNKQLKLNSGEIVFRNPGQIVSFNNLYANIYFSSGLFGLIWFLFILFKYMYYLFKNTEIINYYLAIQFFSMLLMFFLPS